MNRFAPAIHCEACGVSVNADLADARYCLDCNLYTCPGCWNSASSRCTSCAIATAVVTPKLTGRSVRLRTARRADYRLRQAAVEVWAFAASTAATSARDAWMDASCLVIKIAVAERVGARALRGLTGASALRAQPLAERIRRHALAAADALRTANTTPVAVAADGSPVARPAVPPAESRSAASPGPFARPLEDLGARKRLYAGAAAVALIIAVGGTFVGSGWPNFADPAAIGEVLGGNPFPTPRSQLTSSVPMPSVVEGQTPEPSSSPDESTATDEPSTTNGPTTPTDAATGSEPPTSGGAPGSFAPGASSAPSPTPPATPLPSGATPAPVPTPMPTPTPIIAIDTDSDGVPDLAVGLGPDNCPLVWNPDQANADGDALGDACDLDDDNDLIPDLIDPTPR
jgi:hypothetical protein